MHYVEHALREVDQVEEQLELYDVALSSIESQMSQMKNQESFINVSNENTDVLYSDLNRLISGLDLSQDDISNLKQADLTTDQGVEQCRIASSKLLRLKNTEIPPGLNK